MILPRKPKAVNKSHQQINIKQKATPIEISNLSVKTPFLRKVKQFINKLYA
jgi:hypothetical protein